MKREFLMDMYQAVRRVVSIETTHDSFIGGSFRFGYENKDSDLDLFFEVKSDEDRKKVEQSLISIGFMLCHPSSRYPFKTWRLSNILHVCLLDDQTFKQYEDKHIKIESLLRKHPILKLIAEKLKEKGMSGSYIFDLFAPFTV